MGTEWAFVILNTSVFPKLLQSPPLCVWFNLHFKPPHLSCKAVRNHGPVAQVKDPVLILKTCSLYLQYRIKCADMFCCPLNTNNWDKHSIKSIHLVYPLINREPWTEAVAHVWPVWTMSSKTNALIWSRSFWLVIW